MKPECIYDAISGIEEAYLSAADDTAAMRRSFRKTKARKGKLAAAFCICAVLALAAGRIGWKSGSGKTPAVTPEGTTSAAGLISAQEDPLQTEARADALPPESSPAAEADDRIPAADEAQPTAPAKEAEPHSSGAASPAVQQPTQAPAPTEPKTEAQNPAPADGAAVIWGQPGGAASSAYVAWNGKQVGFDLWEVLKKDTAGKTIAIVASPAVNGQFVYNGKTIAAYEARAFEAHCLPEKMQQLLKEGDLLKYGEALYTTGAPNGEKWAESFYRERLAYYGTELLSKYIVNGRFLAEQLKADIETAAADTTAASAYNEAVAAFYAQTSAAAAAAFSAAGAACTVTEQKDAILFFASADRFAALPDPGNAEWYYTLAPSAGGTTVTRA